MYLAKDLAFHTKYKVIFFQSIDATLLVLPSKNCQISPMTTDDMIDQRKFHVAYGRVAVVDVESMETIKKELN